MFWLRPIVVMVCNLVSVPMLFCWLFSWYAFPERPKMVWGSAIISFVAFAATWVYDAILIAISPKDMEIVKML
jgi:hypothetical protein